MNSRDEILAAITLSQPSISSLPDIANLQSKDTFLTNAFVNIITKIGGTVIYVDAMYAIRSHIVQHTKASDRIVTTLPALRDIGELIGLQPSAPHTFNNIDYAVIEANFAVAENGAVWVTESVIGERVLPFICQHLAVLVYAGSIVADMHGAYDKIGADQYGYGTFIAGPSKTADIEQSLVIGAHGPRSMTIYLLT